MKWRRPSRRALILAETLAAGTLLVFGMVMTLQLLRWTADERRSAERRGWALQEAANVMERLSAAPFDSLNEEATTALSKMSAPALEVLPGGRIFVSVNDVKVEKLAMKRISLELHYRGSSGREEAPVRLTAWVARRGR